MLVAGCKSVSIESSPDVSRRFLRKRIARKESRHVRFAFEQPNFEVVDPRVFSRRSQRGEPHLPIEPRLMRRAPARRTHHIAWFPFEFVRQPIDPVRAAFDHDLFTIFRHYAEKPVAVRDPKWFNSFVNECERARPFRFRFECDEDEPPIQRQHHNDHRDRKQHRQSPCKTPARDRGHNSRPAKRCVVNQQQAKCDREQIEETIIARERDDGLQKNEQTGSDEPQPARRPDKKRHNDFDHETEGDRKMFEPFRAFVRPPRENCRQRLRPVVIIERGQGTPMERMIEPAPGVITARQLHHAGHHHQFEEKQLEQEQRSAGERRFAIAFRPPLPRREKDRQETSL